MRMPDDMKEALDALNQKLLLVVMLELCKLMLATTVPWPGATRLWSALGPN